MFVVYVEFYGCWLNLYIVFCQQGEYFTQIFVYLGHLDEIHKPNWRNIYDFILLKELLAAVSSEFVFLSVWGRLAHLKPVNML